MLLEPLTPFAGKLAVLSLSGQKCAHLLRRERKDGLEVPNTENWRKLMVTLGIFDGKDKYREALQAMTELDRLTHSTNPDTGERWTATELPALRTAVVAAAQGVVKTTHGALGCAARTGLLLHMHM